MKDKPAMLPKDFSAAQYLRLNPDVAAEGFDAEWHYLTYGCHEDRKYRLENQEQPPSSEDFDPAAYLRLNPDLAAAGVDAHDHYRNYGKAEGRPYRPSVDEGGTIPEDFDPAAYLRLNPDLAAAGVDAHDHYRNYGKAEGRPYRSKNVPLSLASKIKADPKISAIKSDASQSCTTSPIIISFYLPQYHRIKENDEWWGEGFTEWTNVKKARPNYEGHPQPHRPLNDKYYDLSDIAVQRQQASLAQAYGINAFCYYMYWFDGRRVLEKPLDLRIGDNSIDMDFCICWANENWTRTWDGREQDVLLEQHHSSEGDRNFIRDAMKYLADPRYLRYNGKLVLLVYRVDLMLDSRETAKIWREEVRAAGLGELHLCAVQFYGIDDPRDWGFDAAVEFPPHGWLAQENMPDEPPRITNPDFKGHIFDYKKSVDFALRKPLPDYCWHRAAFPGWDNTARRQDTPHLFADSNAAEFERWVTNILRQQTITSHKDPMIFINAWNEWGEGAHLEPDQMHGYANLEAVRSARATVLSERGPLFLLQKLRTSANYLGRENDELSLMDIFRGYERSLVKLMEKTQD